MNRQCSKCKKWLSLDNFCKKKDTRDGLCLMCRACKKKSDAKSYKKNRDSRAAYAIKYRKENEKKIANQRAIYRKNNKTKIAEKDIEYYKNNKDKRLKYLEDNKEKIAARFAKYYRDNEEYLIKQNRKYYYDNKNKFAVRRSMYYQNNKSAEYANEARHRAAKLNQTPINADLKEIQFYYTVCIETNEILGDSFFHVDHMHPLSKGGLHHEDNLQILEAPINLQKHNKWPLSNEEQLRYEGVTLT